MGEPVESASAPAALTPSPVESVDSVVPVVVPLVDVVVLPPGAVVDGFAPGLVTDEPAAELALGIEPADVLDLLERTGVVLAGWGFGLGAGGRLDEDDGLGFGDGVDVAAPGGGLLGAPPEPNANPMTLPGAGS
jgi:hypothetical protein